MAAPCSPRHFLTIMSSPEVHVCMTDLGRVHRQALSLPTNTYIYYLNQLNVRNSQPLCRTNAEGNCLTPRTNIQRKEVETLSPSLLGLQDRDDEDPLSEPRTPVRVSQYCLEVCRPGTTVAFAPIDRRSRTSMAVAERRVINADIRIVQSR